MGRPSRRLLAVTAAIALLTTGGAAADAQRGSAATTPSVVLVLGGTAGCVGDFERIVCDGFRRALRGSGVTGRIVSPTRRENPETTLEVIARQRSDLVIVFGLDYYDVLGRVARRQPATRFAIVDAPRNEVRGVARNVQGVVFRTSEAAYLAGWLAARLERARPGRDAVGVVAGFAIPSVTDFVIGFRAGARRGAPGIKVLLTYTEDFVDASKCEATARRQVARGAGALFNVAGACGLGTLEAARQAGVWGIGVDTDQSFLGPHILTSVVKRFEAGFRILLRQVQRGRIRTGRDTVLTLADDAVGLGKVRREVPGSLRKELVRLQGRIARGEISVPGTFPDPR